MKRGVGPTGVGILLALAGCDAVAESGRPLTVIEQQPAGAPGVAGASGGADAPDVVVTPSGGGGPAAGDGTTCWDGRIPAEPRAPTPKLTVDEACRRGAATSHWTFRTTPPRATAMETSDDRRGDIVGRWLACADASGNVPPSAGLEFSGNGRWQRLERDPTGVIVGSAVQRGYYYVLGTGQLDLASEGPTHGGGTLIGFVKFADGDADVLHVDNYGFAGVYARVEASPANGDENAPSTFDGRCSMVGTWDVPANPNQPVAPASTWSFDGAGHFVAGPRGTNLCGGHTMYGTYQLTAGFFQLTTNWNLGLCDWWFDAAYPATFDADCSHLKLMQVYDNCTGGRGYLNGTTVLTRTP